MKPKYRAALRDETGYFTADWLRKRKLVKVSAVVLFDETKRVHLASITPSVELLQVDCAVEFEDGVTDEEREAVVEDVSEFYPFDIDYAQASEALRWDYQTFLDFADYDDQQLEDLLDFTGEFDEEAVRDFVVERYHMHPVY
jgi:hypothetical protein